MSVPSTRARIFANAVSREVDVSSPNGENPQSSVVPRCSGSMNRAASRTRSRTSSGRLDARVERVDDADEDPAVAGRMLAEHLEHARPVGLAGELDVEPADVEPEQRRQQVRVVDVGAVGRVLVAARAGVDADPRPFLVRQLAEDLVVQVDERVRAGRPTGRA